jgi:hypothetical protein
LFIVFKSLCGPYIPSMTAEEVCANELASEEVKFTITSDDEEEEDSLLKKISTPKRSWRTRLCSRMSGIFRKKPRDDDRVYAVGIEEDLSPVL